LVGGPPRLWRTISPHRAAAWVFQSRIGDDQFGEIALQPLRQSGVDVSRVRQTAGAVKTGFTVILQA